ncbi:MAG TPA: MFS transporter, partial [Beutenbergiaceae bacterium]|nr:MFS transporter [Beutenbergiaceae bacterium]
AYVRHRTDIIVIMVTVFVVSALGMNFQLTSAVMAREVFGRGAGEYGLLGSVMAIGSLAGALAAARRNRPRVRLVLGAAFGFGVSSGLMAIMPSFWAFSAMSILVGFFTLTMITAANTTIQLGTDPTVRGRVMSLYLMVFFGSNPVGAPVVGWIAENWGARWSIGVGAIASILISVVAILWVKRHWQVEVTYSLRSKPHVILTHPEERAAREQAQLEVAAQQSTNRAA